MGTLQFIGWLKHHLDRRTFDGCVWIDKENQIFKILWPRADKNLTPEKLGVMFKWWTHKFGSTRNHNQPTAIKGNFRSCLNSKVQSSDIRKMKNMDTREDADDWKVFQFVDSLKDNKSNAGYKKRLRANLQESEDSFGWNYSMAAAADSTPIKVEMTDDPLESLKKGPTLKVLVNQPYLSTNQLVKTTVENTIYKSPPHRDITPKTSPTYAPKVKPQLPVEPIFRTQEPPPPYSEMKQFIDAQQGFQHVLDSKRNQGPVLMPIINGSRSLSAVEAKSLMEDTSRNIILSGSLKSPTVLLPGNPLVSGGKPLVPSELLSEYNRLGLLQTRTIHDILKDVLTRKQLLEDTDSAEEKMKVQAMETNEEKKMINDRNTPLGADTDTIPSFLQYIGKELEKLPYDSQEKAKTEIFRVISDLKKQSMYMIPHHWQLAMTRQVQQ